MTKVTISRHWNHPEITTTLTNDDISLQIELGDFLEALKREIGSVAWTFRDKTFSEQIDRARDIVLSKIKEDSIKVV